MRRRKKSRALLAAISFRSPGPPPEIMSDTRQPPNQTLRLLLATIAYRGTRAIENGPENFPDLRLAEGSRTPREILFHIVDLLDWTGLFARGERPKGSRQIGSWQEAVDLFYSSLRELDDLMATGSEPQVAANRLIQGPLADALTHIGQLAMLKRVAGFPVERESYAMADIRIGQVGPEQPPPYNPG